MYKVLGTGDDSWDDCIKRLPYALRDAYYTSGYYRLYELNGEGEGCLFVYESGGSVGVYPFLKKRISGYALDRPYYDIQTAYGYGGPIATDGRSAFLSDFEGAFLEYAQRSDIVAEFIRFHPVMRNHGLFSKDILVERNRTTVLVGLDGSMEDIFANQPDARGRRAIRKANAACLEISNDYMPDAFFKLYLGTMKANNADDYYFFKDEYFAYFANIPQNYAVNVVCGGKAAACGLFMRHGMYAHYHLSGRDSAFSKFYVGHRMIWEAIKYARQRGHKYFHLGGGRSDSADDDLFAFKKQFSGNFKTFYIGKRIINEDIYNYLIDEWGMLGRRESKLFLKYNLNV
jgi:hypothetical protein